MRKIPAVLIATLGFVIIGLGYGITGGIKRLRENSKKK
jgi:hypothetical protein